jgi:hypothetical protein
MDIRKDSDPQGIEIKDAAQFLKALREGKSPQDAAVEVGRPLKQLERSPEVLEALGDLQNYYFQDAAIRKAIVIAKNTKIVITGEDRDSVAASRVLALDPDLGLTGNQNTTVTVNILSDDVKNLDPGNLWEPTPLQDHPKK